MSMVLALLLAQAVTTPTVTASDPVKQEILAIAGKMKAWRGGIYRRDGELTCRIEQSSGDVLVDGIRCGALVKCVGPHADTMDAIAASGLPEADRKARLEAIYAAAQPCIDRLHVAATVKLARARVAGS